MIKQFVVFAAVGAIGTLSHYCVLIVLVQLLGVNPVVASGTGFAVGALVNYLLNYRVTFRSARPHQEAAPRFFAIAAVGMLANTVIMALGTKVFAIQYLLAQIIATGMVLGLNFVANRLWTFR